MIQLLSAGKELNLLLRLAFDLKKNARAIDPIKSAPAVAIPAIKMVLKAGSFVVSSVVDSWLDSWLVSVVTGLKLELSITWRKG
jgi:hypothetical protein